MNRGRTVSPTLGVAALLLCAALSATGCRAKARAVDPMADFPALEVGRLAEPGIELVRCFVPDDAEAGHDGLEALAAEGIEPIETPLIRDGLLVLRVPNDRLKDAIDRLGGSPVTRRTFLGQPDAWLDLASGVPARGVPYFRGGRPVEGDGSILHLDLRGWCFPTVDGARARIELRLSEDRGRVQSVSIDPSAYRVRRWPLPGALAVIEVGPNESLVILARPSSGGTADEGPAAAVPPTVGGLLLPGDPFPERVAVLVVAPSFADILPREALDPTQPAPAEPPLPTDPTGVGLLDEPLAETSPQRSPQRNTETGLSPTP